MAQRPAGSSFPSQLCTASQPARPGAAACSSIPPRSAWPVSLPVLVQRPAGFYLACIAHAGTSPPRVPLQSLPLTLLPLCVSFQATVAGHDRDGGPGPDVGMWRHEVTTRDRLDGGAVAPRRLRPQGPGRLEAYTPIYFGRVAATKPLEDTTQSGRSKGRKHQKLQDEARFDLDWLLVQVDPVVEQILKNFDLDCRDAIIQSICHRFSGEENKKRNCAAFVLVILLELIDNFKLYANQTLSSKSLDSIFFSL